QDGLISSVFVLRLEDSIVSLSFQLFGKKSHFPCYGNQKTYPEMELKLDVVFLACPS
ncbi:unnamed protein product, partial [Allacma fusca]